MNNSLNNKKEVRMLFIFLCKIPIFIRISLIFILVFTYQVHAEHAESQEVKFSLDMKNSSIEKVLQTIEQKSDYYFLYSNRLINVHRIVNIKVKNEAISSVLDKLFKSHNVEFEVKGLQIILSPKEINEIASELIEAKQQQETIKVTGSVKDEQGDPLPGVTVLIEKSTQGVITDLDGRYEITVKPTDILKFSFVGMSDVIIKIDNQSTIDVVMKEKTLELDDITVVAFAKQKKESVIASIETIKPDELRIPASNLTTALAGRMSGIISYQRSGEPGQDNAQFFIRGVTTFGYKKDPLILIDGIELSSDDLSRMHPDDIAAFSIMKDATATALYGARGANGVVLVTTKEGREGKARVNIRVENSISQPTKDIELADPVTYMLLHNEAVRTRDPLGFIPYSQSKVENTINGANPYVYPTTDWQNELLKDYTINQRMNLNISGGGKVARYYISGSLAQDNGILDVDRRNDFNSNIDLKHYLVRSNVNINLTNTTEAAIRVHGTFDDYRGPIQGGEQTYKAIVRSNPVLFPPYYPADAEHQYTNHILFGNYGKGTYINPYAEMVKGYKEYSQSLMLAQFELKQNLSFITNGLRFRLLGNTTRSAYFDVTRNYNPFFYKISDYNNRTDEYKLSVLNSEQGREYLDYQEGQKQVYSTFYAESALDYDRTFAEKHTVTGLLVGIMKQSLYGNAGDLQHSLPFRNLGLSGRLTYAYDSRYFVELNFGYNGSERFSKEERFGFFPSAGLGWLVSSENFWEPLSNVFTEFKLKVTHGLVGNDAIGSNADRFFYLSNVNLNDDAKSYAWGSNGAYYRAGVSIPRYANDKITWETATKSNLGIELTLLDKIMFDIDLFKEYRTNILMDRLTFSTFGLQAPTKANVGEASSQGIDMSVDIQHSFNENFWLTARGNFTYARGIFEKYEEPDYFNTPWLSGVGQPLGQAWGLIAERLFVDDAEVANSPVQELGSIVRGGDIKYRDINGDDKITALDFVPIGYPVTPEIIYGFGVSSGYKNVDVSLFFQGSARSSFWIDTGATSPFANYSWGGDPYAGYQKNNALLQAYADSHWSEANRDIYALWPRLSDSFEYNNLVSSTWFMQNGAFLRLKSLEMGYTMPKNWLKRFGIDNVRFYLSGINLLTFSYFKLWDPEMGGNGLGYPIQRVFNAGLQVSF